MAGIIVLERMVDVPEVMEVAVRVPQSRERVPVRRWL